MDELDYYNTGDPTYEYSNVSNSTSYEDNHNYYDSKNAKINISTIKFIRDKCLPLALLIVTLAVFCSTCFILFLLRKFKNLRTRTNFIFLNLMISCSVLACLVLLTMLVNSNLVFIGIVGSYVSLNATVLFALFLAVDWLITVKYSNVLLKYERWYHYVIIGIYIFASKECLLYWALTTRSSDVPFIIEIFYIGFIFISSGITLNVFYLKRKCRPNSLGAPPKTEYAFMIPCTFFLLWMPLIILYLGFITFGTMFRLHYLTIEIGFLSCQFLCVMALASPLLFVALLPKFDKDFKTSYDYVFKRAQENKIEKQDADDLVVQYVCEK